MRKLIHVVSEFLSRFILAGSLRHAAMGSLAGITIVWLLVAILRSTGTIDAWMTIGIPASLLGGLVGAAVGSRIPERPAVSLTAGAVVTVWNLNHALVPIAAPLILGGIFSFTMFAASHNAKDPVPVAWGWLVLGTTCAIVAAAACMVTYGLRLGGEIRLLKLRGARAYQRSQVIRWGFEIARGRLTPAPPDNACCLIVQFADGQSFECEISSATAQRVARAMQMA
jgi:hypothetical protein